MAICLYCNGEMTTGGSCTVEALFADGRRFEFARHGTERGMKAFRGLPCGDCGVSWGGLHHPGCDLQRCPVCHGQLISCGCLDDDDVDADAETIWDAPLEPYGVDGNGDAMARGSIGGVEVIVHYSDVPDSDITTLDGIRLTTPVRTLIDIATSTEAGHFEECVVDALERGLFTLDEAWERLDQADMRQHPGADVFRRTLRGLH